MVERIMNAIMLLDFLGLIILLIWMRAQKRKHGELSERKFALLLTGYWSFFTITTFAPLFAIDIQVAAILEVGLLCFWWVVGYPWIRWLYRRFTSSK